jgi:hypothetical protein
MKRAQKKPIDFFCTCNDTFVHSLVYLTIQMHYAGCNPGFICLNKKIPGCIAGIPDDESDGFRKTDFFQQASCRFF